MLYIYSCTVLDVTDGDTIKLDIDLGFDTWLRNERVRLANINTPEIRTRDLIAKEFGYLAKARVEELLPIGSEFYLRSLKYRAGGFGRILGDILFDLEPNTPTLTEILIEERQGVPWHEKNRSLMERLELDNREWLMANGKVPQDMLDRIKLLTEA